MRSVPFTPDTSSLHHLRTRAALFRCSGEWYPESMDALKPSPLMRRLSSLALYGPPYLLLAYILSVGPMYWKIHEAYQISETKGFVYRFYYPIVLANEIEYVSNFFDWYLEFWI